MNKSLKGIHFILFVAGVSALCHWLFSWIGFNPTDEGFVLSSTRRILEGQFPHADFLSLRPLGSSYLHIIDIKYGGENVLYFSRLIFWIQSAIIAWVWVAIADKILDLDFNIVYKYFLACVVFIFNVHTFPAMAWTTVDGLFFATIGIFFISHFNKNANQFGYILLGCAALCKQNFLILIPGVWFCFGHFKRPYYIIDGLIPVIVYAFFLWKFDALATAKAQLFGRHELFETGIKSYFTSLSFYGGVVIPLAIAVLRNKHPKVFHHVKFLLAFDLIILGAISLYMNYFTGSFSIALFGFLIGYTIVFIKRKGVLLFNTLTLLLAWTVSISLGYNTPAMASGLVLAAMLVTSYKRTDFALKSPLKYAGAIVVLIGLCFSFYHARTNFVYKDNKAALLETPLANALKGSGPIKTNTLTVDAIKDLNQLHERFGDKLAIAPDYTAYWVTAPYSNPLNIDWPNRGEMEPDYIKSEVLKDLLKKKGKIVIALQKFRASELHIGKNDLNDEQLSFPISTMIQENFEPFSETDYFIIYR